jgi:hypothetical protein
MPNLNHSGPEGQGPKTGRKLGQCKKSENELKQIGELGKGQGKRHHSKKLCGQGKGKRINYFQTINKKGE